MKKLEWEFQPTNTKTNLYLRYGLYEAYVRDITEPQRKALVNLLIALEKDLPHASRND